MELENIIMELLYIFLVTIIIYIQINACHYNISRNAKDHIIRIRDLELDCVSIPPKFANYPLLLSINNESTSLIKFLVVIQGLIPSPYREGFQLMILLETKAVMIPTSAYFDKTA